MAPHYARFLKFCYREFQLNIELQYSMMSGLELSGERDLRFLRSLVNCFRGGPLCWSWQLID